MALSWEARLSVPVSVRATYLVDPFLLLHGCGLSESGLKYDIATYERIVDATFELCLKSIVNNQCLVLSMVFST